MTTSVGSWIDVPCKNPAATPSSRDTPTCVIYKDCIYVFGGDNGSTYFNDSHEFNFSRKLWRVMPAAGCVPSARDSHTCVVYKDSLFVFGGHDGRSRLNDLVEYNFATQEWSLVSITAGNAPSPRSGHAAVVYDKSMYCFGGRDGASWPNDFLEFNFETHTWAPVHATGVVPEPRVWSSLVAYENSCILFGGLGNSGTLNDVHTFDFGQRVWSRVVTEGPAPAPRLGHVAVVFANALYIFGGCANGRMNDFHKLTLGLSQSRKWEVVPSEGATPRECYYHAAVVYDSSLIVIGGDGNANNFSQYRFEKAKTVPDTSLIPESSLIVDLRKLVNNELTSDVTFVVEGSPIYAHKYLCMRSAYFKAMLTSDMRESRDREIPIHDVRRATFLLLLEYLYTDDVEVSVDNAMEVLLLADWSGVDRLKRICENRLLESLCADNAVTILHWADLHNVTWLRGQCVQFILDHFETVCVTPAFEEMSRTNIDLNLELLKLRFGKQGVAGGGQNKRTADDDNGGH